MNEVMSIVGEICGENDWAKEERSIANKVETQGKEGKKLAAVASLDQKKLSILLDIFSLIDAAIKNEDLIAMVWTNKQLQDIHVEVFHWPLTSECHEIGQRGIDKCC